MLDLSQSVDLSYLMDLSLIGLKLKLSISNGLLCVSDLLLVSLIKLLLSKLMSLHDFFISANCHAIHFFLMILKFCNW